MHSWFIANHPDRCRDEIKESLRKVDSSSLRPSSGLEVGRMGEGTDAVLVGHQPQMPDEDAITLSRFVAPQYKKCLFHGDSSAEGIPLEDFVRETTHSAQNDSNEL